MHKLILIGASAGGLQALTRITSILPATLDATILIVMHIGARRSVLPELLQKSCALPVRHAGDSEPLLPGQVLIAPPDRHLTVTSIDGRPVAQLWHGPKENFTRPAIDPLFRSAAAAFDGHVIAVILTGYLDDGTAGLHAVKLCGGYAIVQDPQDAQVPDMPSNAINQVAVDEILRLDAIGPALMALATRLKTSGSDTMPAAEERPTLPEWMEVENRYVRGEAGIEDLQRIGVPSSYTCPECNGALSKINDAVPPRYRCHTGHSFTAKILAELQDQTIETALWSALRALQEKAGMEKEMLQDAESRQNTEEEKGHLQRFEKLQADIDTLHALLVT